MVIFQNKSFCFLEMKNPLERFSKSVEDEELIILENLSFLEGKEDIKKLVKGQLLILLVRMFIRYLTFYQILFIMKKTHKNKLFASVFTIRPEVDAFNISLDRKALINLMNLNQLDRLASVMKSEIKKVVLNKNQRARNFGIEALK